MSCFWGYPDLMHLSVLCLQTSILISFHCALFLGTAYAWNLGHCVVCSCGTIWDWWAVSPYSLTDMQSAQMKLDSMVDGLSAHTALYLNGERLAYMTSACTVSGLSLRHCREVGLALSMHIAMVLVTIMWLMEGLGECWCFTPMGDWKSTLLSRV